jgi:hypothetical protein
MRPVIPLAPAAPQAPAPEAAADTPAAAALPLLLYDTADLCAVLRIGLATLHRLKARGALPRARKLAGLK